MGFTSTLDHVLGSPGEPWGPLGGPLGLQALGTPGLGDPGPWGPLGPWGQGTWGPYIRTVPRAPERGRPVRSHILGFTHLIHGSPLSFSHFFEGDFCQMGLDGVILGSFAAVGRFPAGRKV